MGCWLSLWTTQHSHTSYTGPNYVWVVGWVSEPPNTPTLPTRDQTTCGVLAESLNHPTLPHFLHGTRLHVGCWLSLWTTQHSHTSYTGPDYMWGAGWVSESPNTPTLPTRDQTTCGLLAESLRAPLALCPASAKNLVVNQISKQNVSTTTYCMSGITGRDRIAHSPGDQER